MKRALLSTIVIAAIAVRCVTAEAFQADEDLIHLVVNLLGEQDPDLRALGLEQVRTEAKGETATRRFAEQLPKLPPDGQVGLLRALAERGDKAARPAVVELLQTTRDEAVRVAAIGSLGSLGQPQDLTDLMQRLDEGSKAEQTAARASLVRIQGPGVTAAIARGMQRAKPHLRVALIEILAARRALDTIPDLLQSAIDDNATVRSAAMSALAEIAGPEHMPGMVEGLLKAKPGAEREAAEKAIMFVSNRIPDAERRADPLMKALEKLDEAERTTLLPALGRVGGLKALRTIETAIADAERHDVGVRALCYWPNASVADRLIELAKADEHDHHRTMALAALIRIAPLPDGRSDQEKLELTRKVMAMCKTDPQRKLMLKRASAIRTVETLRFILPYLDQPEFAEQACESIVELAHHRGLREPHKAEFHQALDRVIATSKDAVVIDRANRYKRDQTWVRPKAPSRN